MVQKATIDDKYILAKMAVQMWDSHTVEELETEFAKNLNNDNSAFFIQYENNMPIGFAQCGLRMDYVEGTKSSPVGYLEGIFVKPKYQNKGYARELLSACENWAISKGCIEFASDCELDNDKSLMFHMAMGFEEANRVICFRKSLTEDN